jgi:hypothetical protein
MTQDVKIIGFINCYLFFFLVVSELTKENRRLLYCFDIIKNVSRASPEPPFLLSFQ